MGAEMCCTAEREKISVKQGNNASEEQEPKILENQPSKASVDKNTQTPSESYASKTQNRDT